MYKEAPEREASEALSREDNAILASNGDLQYHIDLSTRVTVQDEVPQENDKDGTLTCREQVRDPIPVGHSMVQRLLL